MFSTGWFWLYVASKFIGGISPYAIPVIGQILGLLTMIARIVFIVVVFFVCEWWQGLILAAINFILIPILTPKVDPTEMSGVGRGISAIISLASPVLLILAFVALL